MGSLAKIFPRKTMCYSNSVLVISAILVILPLLTQSQVFFGNEGSRRPSSDFFFPNTETNNNKGSQKNDVSLRNILGLEGEQQNIVGRFGITARKGQSCTDPRGIQGTCNYIFDSPCSNILRAIRTLGVTQELIDFLLKAIKAPCGFEQFDYTLCCVETGNQGTQTTTKSPPTTSTTTTTTTTTSTTTAAPELSCGIQDLRIDSTRIVNGEEADPGAWPWAAVIGVPSGRNGIRVMCGGTLINRNHVLTAAHCFGGGSRATTVRLADLDINTNGDFVNHEDVAIQTNIIHPAFDSKTLKNDIALVKLQRPVTFRRGLRPACLPDKYRGFPLDSLSDKPTIIGWGSTATGRPTVTHLRQAIVPLVDNPTCNKNYEQVEDIENIGATQICAGLGERDSCQGDSGGPMLSSELDNGRIWSVIGITSFGVKCADSRFPGVYTRVDKYLDWIESNSRDSTSTRINFG